MRSHWFGYGVALLISAQSARLLEAQRQSIGTVSLEDASVTGQSAILNDRAILTGSGVVTAKDRPADVQLSRGGWVRVCSTSGLHLTAGAIAPKPITASMQDAPPETPLMLALDRGAIEVHAKAVAGDLLMTPDLRIAFSEAGPLDLRMRVTRNGDTCVENRVIGNGSHPALQIGSLFGDGTYNVLPGQHVLFEHASLHEVVDSESSPCGCPDQSATPAAISLSSGNASGTDAAAQHPFPAAISQGLAPPPPVPQAPPGQVHAQVAATLTYDSTDPALPPSVADPPPARETVAAQPSAPIAARKAPSEGHGLFHAVGRFFRWLF